MAGRASRASDGSPIEQLLALVDEAFDHKAWHGTTLRGSLRGVTARQADWRPAPGRHTIHDLVVHAAYWKYAVGQRLTGGVRGRFARKGSNWFDTTHTSWQDDLQLLDDEHRQLRQVIATFPPGLLRKPVKGKSTAGYLIRGIAAHDLYHAGQIQLLKRLQRV
jgi:hypothetical protein